MDENIIGCLYNLDKKDLEWIQETLKNKPVDSYPHSDTISKDLDADAVELIFSNLEKLANEKVLVALMFTLCNSTQLSGECPTLEEFQSYLEIERPDLLLEPNSIGPFLKVVYSWWKHRRFSLRHGKPVRPSLKFEEIPPGVNDSYVCFRKRDSRPVRKTRRCDTVSLDRLHRLREEFARSREILLAVSERERLRREILEVDVRVFEARIKVRRIKKLLGMPTTSADVDQSPEKAVRKKGGASGSGSRTIKLKLAPIRFRGDSAGGLASGDAAAVSVEERIKRRKVMDEREGWADLTEVLFACIFTLPLTASCHTSPCLYLVPERIFGIPISVAGCCLLLKIPLPAPTFTETESPILKVEMKLPRTMYIADESAAAVELCLIVTLPGIPCGIFGDRMPMSTATTGGNMMTLTTRPLNIRLWNCRKTQNSPCIERSILPRTRNKNAGV